MRSNTLPSGLRGATQVGLFLTLALCASLFASRAQAQTFTVLYSFQGGTDGFAPRGDLLRDADGILYGTTVYGGGYSGEGTAFRLNSQNKETILYRFLAGYGAYPMAGLVSDDRGTFYGTTFKGGAYGLGTVFKLGRGGHERVLHSFSFGEGSYSVDPQALVRDDVGNLYGATSEGGRLDCNDYYGCGAIFKVSKTGRTKVLYAFTGGDDGLYPVGALARDKKGNLYGAATYGGAHGCGTVFKLDSAGHFTVLHAFTGTGDGCMPEAGLILDAAGNLYGTTWYGPTGYGSVFKVDSSGNETILYGFLGPPGDGQNPQATLTRDGSGNIFGTTGYGGSSSNCYEGCGIVFALDSSGKETVLHNFTGATDDGADPAGGMVLDDASSLYGTTQYGGDSSVCGMGCGVVFKVTP